ncbi:MAG TPA: hypothetical protein VMH39_17830 [Gemmatimonadaceae bacterium]|nr:hypothetical protein [Gemmatimonadaceae bacterium]
MNADQGKTLYAYQRSLSFLDANAALLGTIPQSAPRKTLDGVVAMLAASVSSQGATNATKKGLTNQVKSLRSQLILGHMRPIAAIVADKVTTIPQVPALKAPALDVRSQSLVGLANAMVEGATPYAQTFIDEGLPATFLADLTAAAAALNTAITTQGTTKAQTVAATAALTAALKQGRASLNVISTQVVTALAGNAPLLKQWANVKRISPKPPTSTLMSPPSVASPALTTPTPAPVAAPTPEVKGAA